MASLCAIVTDVSAAEATRRALDREGLLDLKARAFSHDGAVALPLSASAQDLAVNGALSWSGGRLQTSLLMPPQRRGASPLRAAFDGALAQLTAPPDTVAALQAVDSLPKKWEKLGDCVLFAARGIFDEGTLAGGALRSLTLAQQAELWAALASALGAKRLGVQACIEESLHRKSRVQLIWPLAGADGWTVHRENAIVYGLDVTRSMFSSGNGTEKARVAGFRCEGETVVDLYAGIGYFTLNYLVHAGVSHLHACEWDEDALCALRHNLQANNVAERCTVHPGDNAQCLPALAGVAHRVNLGLIPSSEAGWPVAIGVLRPEGGVLHVHANVSSVDGKEAEWAAAMLARMQELIAAAGHGWTARLLHIAHVKWYAPKIRHVVADVECRA